MHWRRVRGTRSFELRLQGDGALIARGVQQVVTLDGKTMRPSPPPEALMENFLIENPRLISQGQLPNYQANGNDFKMEREVEWRDLDTFEHVNNATYASFAENLMIRALESTGWSPSDFKTRDFGDPISTIPYPAPVPGKMGRCFRTSCKSAGIEAEWWHLVG